MEPGTGVKSLKIFRRMWRNPPENPCNNYRKDIRGRSKTNRETPAVFTFQREYLRPAAYHLPALHLLGILNGILLLSILQYDNAYTMARIIPPQ